MSINDRRLSRRHIIGAASIGAAALWTPRLVRPGAAALAASSSCVLTPEVTEGPYWIANHLTRRDVTDGQSGIPLLLHLSVENAATCRPIQGADVEIWHSNARGVYSGVQGNTTHFLRGHQKTGSKGLAIFKTIYPGWYPGRTPHIHVKVHVGGNTVHTGQLFFKDTVSDSVYRHGAYASHGEPDTANSRDNIYAQAGGTRAQLALRKRSGGGFVGAITMGVKT